MNLYRMNNLSTISQSHDKPSLAPSDGPQRQAGHNGRGRAANLSQSRPAMTVCQLVHGLPVGGAEVLVTRIIRRLRDRYRVIVACLDEVGQLGEELSAEGIHVVQLDRRPGFDWNCVRQLRRLLIAEHVKLIHAHQYTPFTYALATRLFGRRPPVLLTEHGRFFPDCPSLKRKWLSRLLTDSRDRFVAVGQSVRQALIDIERLPPPRVEVVCNGIDLSPWQTGNSQRTTTRAELGVSEDEFLVLQVARLDPIKEHGTAIRAIALAARRNPRIRLFIVGDGPESANIERLCTQDGHSRVTMLGMRNDVPRLLAAADAFLLTSLSEGIPVTVLEAMAAGVPVVSTNVGGVPEIVQDGITGLLAPSRDAARLADALVRLAENPTLRAELARSARNRVERQFSEQVMIASYDRIYREMLHSRTVAA